MIYSSKRASFGAYIFSARYTQQQANISVSELEKKRKKKDEAVSLKKAPFRSTLFYPMDSFRTLS